MISAERATEIAGLYYDDVYHLCLSRLRKEADAADVTQEIFLFFQEKYSDLEDSSIKSWLFSVANNKIKEQFRHIAKREKELIFGTVNETQTSTDILYEITMNTEYAEEWTYIEQDVGTNIIRALVAAVPVLLSLIKRKQIADTPHPRYIDICINFSVITFGLYLFASVTSGIFIGRLPMYCEIFNLILFPWLISVPYKNDRKIYTMLLFAFYALYFIYQMQIVWNLPYYSPVFGIID